MSDFNKLYDEFIEYMVSFFLEHQEYEKEMRYLGRHPIRKQRFVKQLFKIWMFDRGRVAWYIAHYLGSLPVK